MPIGDGRKVVAAAGTAEKLSAPSVSIVSAHITALSTNTGIVTVGGPTTLAAPASRRGVALAAGAMMRVDKDDQVDDLSQLWVDATVSGEGISYSYTFEA